MGECTKAFNNCVYAEEMHQLTARQTLHLLLTFSKALPAELLLLLHAMMHCPPSSFLSADLVSKITNACHNNHTTVGAHQLIDRNVLFAFEIIASYAEIGSVSAIGYIEADF